MIKHNGTEIVEMANVHGYRQGMSNSPTMQAACDRFLMSRGIDPKDGAFRVRISGAANAAVARKARRK